MSTTNAVPPAEASTTVSEVEPLRDAARPAAETKESLEALSQRLNDFMRETARELEFQVNDDGGSVVIYVRQSETGEILRAIPPEEARGLADRLSEGAATLISQLA
ncbi:flagellar protein FlaG [Chromatocurvus halotolerans]|uniref:flagellar protein FlaG n=1 Tax=Chromatocurvus halotolerans TaxID=1132028 RepID=UPI0013C34ECD|nr:flagellar protein FlaG [Chromatocurvus halotolerans]